MRVAFLLLLMACADAVVAPDHPCGRAMAEVIQHRGPPLTVRQEAHVGATGPTAYYERWFYLDTVHAFSWGGQLTQCVTGQEPRRPGDLL